MKKILASILAVVLLGTMAISGFAAETAEPAADAALLIAEDTAIVSGTAQTGINEDGIVANYNNGILEVTLPKAAPVIPETKKIAIN